MVFVLTLGDFLALGIELRLGVDVSVVVAVLFDAPGDATLEPGKAIGLAVEVAVLALACGFALHVFDDHVGFAIGVVVLPALAGIGAGDFGPGIGLAIAHAVPGFPDQGTVLAVAEPTVHPAVVIAILQGALGKPRRIVDDLVCPAVAVAVGSLFANLLVVVKEEINFGAGQGTLGRLVRWVLIQKRLLTRRLLTRRLLLLLTRRLLTAGRHREHQDGGQRSD